MRVKSLKKGALCPLFASSRSNQSLAILSFIIFGVTKKFAKKMEKMGVEPKQTDWYVGPHPFAIGIFAGNIQDFSSSLSSAMATVPSSSGGFSGGSAGGGFGGGGGGSW